jgi:hypothetical protein
MPLFQPENPLAFAQMAQPSPDLVNTEITAAIKEALTKLLQMQHTTNIMLWNVMSELVMERRARQRTNGVDVPAAPVTDQEIAAINEMLQKTGMTQEQLVANIQRQMMQPRQQPTTGGQPTGPGESPDMQAPAPSPKPTPVNRQARRHPENGA